MTCASILSELIIVGGLIALGFIFYATSDRIKPSITKPGPKAN